MLNIRGLQHEQVLSQIEVGVFGERFLHLCGKLVCESRHNGLLRKIRLKYKYYVPLILTPEFLLFIITYHSYLNINHHSFLYHFLFY
jgi:hypothetical protein